MKIKAKDFLEFGLGLAVCGILTYYGVKWNYINNKPVKEGADNWRSYFRSDGIPKIAYDNPSDANQAAIKSMLLSGEPFNAYSRRDGKYSIGHGGDGDGYNWPFVTIGKFLRLLKSLS